MTSRLLLIEDSDDEIELTLRALEKHDLHNGIVVARDGVEALDYLFCTGPHASRAPELPEVVLLDLKLPKLDGLEILRRIREDPRTRFLAVVVLTSSTEDRDLVESYKLGANSYVRKPVSFNELVEATRQLGLYWLVLNRRVPAHVR